MWIMVLQKISQKMHLRLNGDLIAEVGDQYFNNQVFRNYQIIFGLGGYF